MHIAILGQEPKVTFSGSCYSFSALQITGSEVNSAFERVANKLGALLKETQDMTLGYRQAPDAQTKKNFEDRLIALDGKKVAFLDSLKKANPFFSDYVALNTYPSYFSVKDKGKYKDEIDYFQKEYFQFVNFKDASYNDQPAVFEAFRNYTTNLTNLLMVSDIENHKKFIENQLDKIPANTKAYKSALAGVVVAMMNFQHINYFYFAEKYIKLYQKEEPEITAQLQAHLNQLKPQQTFIIGTDAPDFTLNTPEGKTLSLSSFKGKVVLVDFWASWCGPCRRENPNVLKVYNKYKSKGFDILGVSLDNSKDRWVQAIEQDD